MDVVLDRMAIFPIDGPISMQIWAAQIDFCTSLKYKRVHEIGSESGRS